MTEAQNFNSHKPVIALVVPTLQTEYSSVALEIGVGVIRVQESSARTETLPKVTFTVVNLLYKISVVKNKLISSYLGRIDGP